MAEMEEKNCIINESKKWSINILYYPFFKILIFYFKVNNPH